MKTILSVLVLIMTTINLFSQISDTTYFNKNDKQAQKSDYYYSKVVQIKKDTVLIREFYYNGNIKSEAKYSTNGIIIRPNKLKKYFSRNKMQKQGKFVTYDTLGHMTGEAIYKDGEIAKGTRIFDANGDTIYTVVDSMPQFGDGERDSFRRFIAYHLEYPEIAQENSKQGTVFVQFVVNKAGKVTDIKVVKHVSPSLDAEAVRVIRSSPAWKPGILHGKPVNVQFTMPIVFQFQ